ncbi:MAG: DNA cytosine methyltransferase [Steroidobacteraceae bacterium]
MGRISVSKAITERDPRSVPFNYIDLFAGCGGFSLGLKRAGMNCVAAIDVDAAAVKTFKQNFPHVPNVLERDLTKFTPEQLRAVIGDCRVDAVFGGPPCQGFSKVRRVDGTNNGARMVQDPRRLLYRNYLHYVEFFAPAIFVMENVPGIRNAAGGEFFTAIQSAARKLGYRVHAAPILAWQYGVPQKRERQLIIGTRSELPMFSTSVFVPRTHEDPKARVNSRRPTKERRGRGRPRNLQPPVTLWEAIGDLPPVRAGGGNTVAEYDPVRGRAHLERYGKRFLVDVLEVHRAEALTAHVARPHSERDLRDFDRLREGETSKEAIERGERMEFPYDRSHFKDRYTKQHRERLCSTIVAHLSKDGLMFIHPVQRRSLTVREAARVQTFPDWFQLPRETTAAFRLIGNAVPPLLAGAMGHGVKRYLAASLPARQLSPMPKSATQAARWLLVAVTGSSANSRRMRELPMDEFKRAWFSLGFLHSGLHPDSVHQPDNRVLAEPELPVLLAKVAPEFAAPVYAASGWPVHLVPLAKEAARRYLEGRLNTDEYYCSQAQLAGLKWARKHSGGEWHLQSR